MLQAMHLMFNNVAGCGVSEGRFPPCSGVLGRTTFVFSCSSQCYHIVHSRVKVRGIKCASRSGSFVCEVRRNPESFSRQNKHGFSRSRKWLNEERDNFENFEEDMLSSKNGSLASHSSTPKNHANASPRPREEIIALFKKVQARLRERATIKEVKKVETSQAQTKENDHVNSLLKLLRKHSFEQVNSVGGREKNLSLDQLQDGDQDNESQSPRFSDLDDTPSNEVQETNISFVARPPSNFQRRSPVPRLKYQPVSYEDKDVNAVPLSNVIVEKDQDQIGIKLERDCELEVDPKDEFSLPKIRIVEMSQDDSFDSEQIYNDDHGEGQQVEQHENLSTMKLSELRALAKSRGLKGFSNMKKGELLELLTGS